jgi:hypothetical protein
MWDAINTAFHCIAMALAYFWLAVLIIVEVALVLLAAMLLVTGIYNLCEKL